MGGSTLTLFFTWRRIWFCSLFTTSWKQIFAQLKTSKQEVTLKKLPVQILLSALGCICCICISHLFHHSLYHTYRTPKQQKQKIPKSTTTFDLVYGLQHPLRQEPFCTSQLQKQRKAILKENTTEIQHFSQRKNAVLPRLMHKMRSSSTGDLSKTAKHNSYSCSPQPPHLCGLPEVPFTAHAGTAAPHQHHGAAAGGAGAGQCPRRAMGRAESSLCRGLAAAGAAWLSSGPA